MKEAVRTYKALSDPTRLRIILLLMREKLCVCELTYILKMEQSRISHQLSLLKYAELVEDRRDGKWMIYSIPKDRRKLMESILEKSFQMELQKSDVIKKDLKNLKICLKEEIRRKA